MGGGGGGGELRVVRMRWCTASLSNREEGREELRYGEGWRGVEAGRC